MKSNSRSGIGLETSFHWRKILGTRLWDFLHVYYRNLPTSFDLNPYFFNRHDFHSLFVSATPRLATHPAKITRELFFSIICRQQLPQVVECIVTTPQAFSAGLLLVQNLSDGFGQYGPD